MKSLIAFTKKEFVAQFRSGKIFFLGGIALLVGIMNPAVAKLTPWIIDLLKEALEETGMTITDYITKRRIENAQDLLENTSFPVQDIASLSGYDDPAYFTRIFKKMTGISPRDYRKKTAVKQKA